MQVADVVADDDVVADVDDDDVDDGEVEVQLLLEPTEINCFQP